MNKSESIANIAKALNHVQANLKGAKADAENPFFKSKYADLNSVWEACRQLLGENGLSVIQTAELVGETPCLNTCLLHTSGEWISGSLPLYAKSLDPQGMGSALSYARRYSLAAILGITQEDDDGEKSMSRKAHKEELPPIHSYEPEFTSASPGDPGEFITPYGKDKGKKIKEGGKVGAMRSLTYWQETLAKKNEKPHRQLADYMSALQAYIKQADMPETQEDIPF